MGLCKCPKRQVTNQFCFEHRVNVCEHCIVRQHNKCIIQSYLQWLKDSDYDSSCKLCGNPLQSEETNEQDCIRLICYHVFHWECLNQLQLSLPSNTAPSGRKCPMCSDPIFPPANLVSPVCEALRNRLSQVNWGRNELGLPLLSHEKLNVPFTPAPKESIAQSRKSDFILGSEAIPRPEVSHSILNIESDIRESRRPLLAREPPIGSSDRDDNKYQRRTPREIFSRWSRRFYAPASRPVYRRTWFQILAGVILFLFVIYIMATLGRRTSSSNPMLDMEMNPNLIQHED